MQENTLSCWAGVASLSDLLPGTNRAFQLRGRSILVCHSTAGVYAVENRCTHHLSSLEDATWCVAGTMPTAGSRDKPAFTRLLSGVLGTCTGAIRITPTSYVAEGRHVAVEAESYTQTRSGRTYNNLYHFLFTIRDGKI